MKRRYDTYGPKDGFPAVGESHLRNWRASGCGCLGGSYRGGASGSKKNVPHNLNIFLAFLKHSEKSRNSKGPQKRLELFGKTIFLADCGHSVGHSFLKTQPNRACA
jgi:hypothetical protein